MKKYIVSRVESDGKTYYYITYTEDMSIVKGPTKYLTHKTKARCSPNTVKRIAFSLSYYLIYLEENGLTLGDIVEMKYDKQHVHFTEFLYWLQAGKHTEDAWKKKPDNNTCNTYLQDVFGWFQFLELQEDQFGSLKVLSSHVVSFTNTIGLRFSMTRKTFKGYLPDNEHIGRTIEQENIIILLEACPNVRDQLMLLLLAETGFRIGELLGVRYTEDIDYQAHTVRVQFRENNKNNARAKYAEYRRAKISPDTFEILMYYLSEYRELLKSSEYLFVNLSGATIGHPVEIGTVYAMLERLENKTNVKATPHMLRHYFANARKKNGWDITMISRALGHKHIETTMRYLNINDDELIEATDKYYEKHKGLYMAEQLL